MDVSDFHSIDNPLIAVHAFAHRMLTLLSVDEILLPRYVNCSINFNGLSPRVEVTPFLLKTPELCFVYIYGEDSATSYLFYATQ